MKRALYISFLCMAAFVMLSASMLPHHHHGTVICTESHEECGEHHRHGSQGEGGSCSCAFETEYTDKYERENEQCTPDCGHDHHFHLFPAICFYVQPLLDHDSNESSPLGGAYIIHYKSVDTIAATGLRGPPASVC